MPFVLLIVELLKVLDHSGTQRLDLVQLNKYGIVNVCIFA